MSKLEKGSFPAEETYTSKTNRCCDSITINSMMRQNHTVPVRECSADKIQKDKVVARSAMLFMTN